MLLLCWRFWNICQFIIFSIKVFLLCLHMGSHTHQHPKSHWGMFNLVKRLRHFFCVLVCFSSEKHEISRIFYLRFACCVDQLELNAGMWLLNNRWEINIDIWLKSCSGCSKNFMVVPLEQLIYPSRKKGKISIKSRCFKSDIDIV